MLEENKAAALKLLVKPLGFKVAKLFMQKGEVSNLDSFMTAHDTDYASIVRSTSNAVKILQTNGYNVRRYKIENILLDVRLNQ